jgi:hypothetical protein
MPRMGFNKRRMESERAAAAAKEAEARRALSGQMIEDAERRVEAWNARQAKHMPVLFSPTIAPPSPRVIGSSECAARPAADQRHRSAHVRSPSRSRGDKLIPALSCRSCRPNAPFAELVRLSRASISEEATRRTYTTRVR